MIEVTSSIEIRHSLLEVADFAACPENMPLWQQGVDRVRRQTPEDTQQALQVGEAIDLFIDLLGTSVPVTYVVEHHQTRQLLVLNSVQGSIRLQNRYSWNALSDDHTEMTIHTKAWTSGLLWRLAEPVIARRIRRTNEDCLRALAVALHGGSGHQDQAFLVG